MAYFNLNLKRWFYEVFKSLMLCCLFYWEMKWLGSLSELSVFCGVVVELDFVNWFSWESPRGLIKHISGCVQVGHETWLWIVYSFPSPFSGSVPLFWFPTSTKEASVLFRPFHHRVSASARVKYRSNPRNCEGNCNLGFKM